MSGPLGNSRPQLNSFRPRCTSGGADGGGLSTALLLNPSLNLRHSIQNVDLQNIKLSFMVIMIKDKRVFDKPLGYRLSAGSGTSVFFTSLARIAVILFWSHRVVYTDVGAAPAFFSLLVTSTNRCFFVIYAIASARTSTVPFAHMISSVTTLDAFTPGAITSAAKQIRFRCIIFCVNFRRPFPLQTDTTTALVPSTSRTHTAAPRRRS